MFIPSISPSKTVADLKELGRNTAANVEQASRAPGKWVGNQANRAFGNYAAGPGRPWLVGTINTLAVALGSLPYLVAGTIGLASGWWPLTAAAIWGFSSYGVGGASALRTMFTTRDAMPRKRLTEREKAAIRARLRREGRAAGRHPAQYGRASTAEFEPLKVGYVQCGDHLARANPSRKRPKFATTQDDTPPGDDVISGDPQDIERMQDEGLFAAGRRQSSIGNPDLAAQATADWDHWEQAGRTVPPGMRESGPEGRGPFGLV